MGLFNFFKKNNTEYQGNEKQIKADELNKKGVELLDIDNIQAVACFQEAIRLGSVKAMRNLGICYFKGKGIDCDFEKAVYWYEEAAKNGNVNSMRDVASLYAVGGTNVPKNDEKARYWFQRATDAGDEKAEERLRLFGLQ